MEKSRGIRKYRRALLLAAAAALTACGPSGGGKPASPAAESGSAGATASQAEKNAQTTPSVDGIESIQAYTDGTIYGTGVVEVDVSYRDGVDLSGITPDSYILEDRGSLSPEFGTLRISGASVDGNTVKLMISNLPQATENNQLVYTGDGKTGARERNAFGIYCTGSWYRDESGDIHFGRTDTEHYKANTTGMGWQARHCLELKLRHAGEAEDKAVCLADEKGEYASGDLWKETVDRQFGEDGFRSIYDLKITSTGNNASDGTGDPCVFALEPGDSGWKSAEEEQPYLEAALTAYNDRTWYSNYSTSYMAGYGKGGSALQAFAMAHPTGFISAVFADASDISDDYISRTGMMTNDAQTDILKNAIPLPVWEINAGDAVKSYWLRANYCERLRRTGRRRRDSLHAEGFLPSDLLYEERQSTGEASERRGSEQNAGIHGKSLCLYVRIHQI